MSYGVSTPHLNPAHLLYVFFIPRQLYMGPRASLGVLPKRQNPKSGKKKKNRAPPPVKKSIIYIYGPFFRFIILITVLLNIYFDIYI